MRTQPTAVAMRSALKTLFTTLAAIISVCCFQVIAAQARSVTYNLDIPAQNLNDALQALALASQHKLLYSSELVDGKRALAIKGEFTTEQAVGQLLTGTGLIYEVSDGLVLIRSKDTPLPVSKQMEGVATSLSLFASDKNYPSPREGGRVMDQGLRVAQNEKDQATHGQNANPQSSDAKDDKLEEIIVTAQRREQELQDVPISISVIGGEELDSAADTGVTDALRSVPGVAVNQSGQGLGTQISMRGVSASSGFFVGSTTVGYYLDSVPFALVRSAVVPDAGVYDLSRVEVLRGPQGTLYGANSEIGVVRVLTNTANLDKFEFKGRTSYSNTEHGGDNYRGDVAVNVPLMPGVLAARGVISYQDQSGWIDKAGRKDANDAKIKTGRLRVNAKPTERLAFDLSAWFSRSDIGAPPYSADNRTSVLALDEPQATDYDIYAMTVRYDFDYFTLTSSTSSIDYVNESFWDRSSANFPGVRLNTTYDSTIFTQELNLNSMHAGPWRWSVGGIYREGEDRVMQFFGPFTPLVPVDWTDTSESYAVFGEVTREFAEGKFELTAGLRYFHDDVGIRENQDFNGIGPLYGRDASFQKTSPRLVLTWHPTEDLTAYASYAEGFRSGSDQNSLVAIAAPTFPSLNEDNLSNYEVGAHGSLADGRLRFDAALYRLDWQDVQQPILIAFNGAFISGNLNGESASGFGYELGVSADVTGNLEMGVTVGWNDLANDADVIYTTSSGSIPVFPAGSRVNFSPEYTANAFAEYSLPLSGDYEAFFSLSANYVDTTEARGLAGTTVVVLETDQLVFSDASIALETPGGWTASLFAQNVFNEDGRITNSGAPFIRDVRPRPRTIGLQLTFKY